MQRVQMSGLVVLMIGLGGGQAWAQGCPADMVAVGPLCVDTYEASVWGDPEGTETQYGVTDDYPCDDTGNGCKDMIYAVSRKDALPSILITWFQAQQACVNAGKRLLRNAEWQAAAAGTPDPGATPGGEDCNTMSAGPEGTGSRENCISDWGAFDMVGNVWISRTRTGTASCRLASSRSSMRKNSSGMPIGIAIRRSP